MGLISIDLFPHLYKKYQRYIKKNLLFYFTIIPHYTYFAEPPLLYYLRQQDKAVYKVIRVLLLSLAYPCFRYTFLTLYLPTMVFTPAPVLPQLPGMFKPCRFVRQAKA